MDGLRGGFSPRSFRANGCETFVGQLSSSSPSPRRRQPRPLVTAATHCMSLVIAGSVLSCMPVRRNEMEGQGTRSDPNGVSFRRSTEFESAAPSSTSTACRCRFAAASASPGASTTDLRKFALCSALVGALLCSRRTGRELLRHVPVRRSGGPSSRDKDSSDDARWPGISGRRICVTIVVMKCETSRSRLQSAYRRCRADHRRRTSPLLAVPARFFHHPHHSKTAHRQDLSRGGRHRGPLGPTEGHTPRVDARSQRRPRRTARTM